MQRHKPSNQKNQVKPIQTKEPVWRNKSEESIESTNQTEETKERQSINRKNQ